ncbi:unnamed protein product [Moneuplotes crassus]|uniref:Uncharacterized protein n=1 Tax=Euplotes crassus TaxID=5936 RepID=A0AAD1Y0M3_EUPCR|nr:unnamed protein product [Moneuplotes crassus]
MSYALAACSSFVKVPIYFLIWSTLRSACQFELFLDTPIYLDLLLRFFLCVLLAFLAEQVNLVTYPLRIRNLKLVSLSVILSSLVLRLLFLRSGSTFSYCSIFCWATGLIDMSVCSVFRRISMSYVLACCCIPPLLGYKVSWVSCVLQSQ